MKFYTTRFLDMLSWDNTTLEGNGDAVGLPGNGSFDGNWSTLDSTINPNSHGNNYYNFDFDAFNEEFRFKFAWFLWQRLTPFLSVICIIGNSIIILVLSRKKSRKLSTSMFIISLAISDMFATAFFLEGFLLTNGFIVQTYNEIDCKLRLFLPRIWADASNIMIAIISIERAVSVKVPHKVKLIFTAKIAKLLVAIDWIICFASACLTSYVYTFTTKLGTPLCLIDRNNKFTAYHIYFVVGKILIIAPWIVNGFCMVFIINALVKNAVVKGKYHKKQVKSVTKTLLIVNIVYFICVTPSVCYDTYTFVVVTYVRPVWYIWDYLNHFNVNNILMIFTYTNNVLNFFIYFLIGSRFRNETKYFFLSCKCCKISHQRAETKNK